jgi:alpha-amylase/alpha-mannosidase (GH57 family)
LTRYLCIHSHFYQPPRENPWLEEVELQESALPYHDWNARITAECYEANACSRILDDKGFITDIVNNYVGISFNFGPTLLSWMERHDPKVYRLIQDSDRFSQEKFSGHGSALAQVYNHIIMPLANRRDKETQVIWGIRDFEYRFGRKPEGMWLPETAVDLETLEILVEHGIKFTILAPHQAKRIRKIGETAWQDVTGAKIDPRRAYACKLPSGKGVTLFFYEGPIAQELAFGTLLNNGETFANRLLSSAPEQLSEAQLINVATDGETYGHHHRFADMALAYCLHYVESKKLAKLTIYGEFLEKHPPMYEVEITEKTSWSCVHGIERWQNNCGCNSGAHPEWSQAWRKPLREAMDTLRDKLAAIYQKDIELYFSDPWQARNDYIDLVLDRSENSVDDFISAHATRSISAKEKIVALKLLEMERHAMLMYTSCGWFFDDISGIETVQVMQYAARAIQLARDLTGNDLEPEYIAKLVEAKGNLADYPNGAIIYEKLVRPMESTLVSVGAHFAIMSLFNHNGFNTNGDEEENELYCYTLHNDDYELITSGRNKVIIGKTGVKSKITLEEATVNFGMLYMGEHNLLGGVAPALRDEEAYALMKKEIKSAVMKGSIPEIISLIDRHFRTHDYSLKHLFKDDQRRILEQIVANTMKDTEAFFQQIYERYDPLMEILNEAKVPMPKALTAISGFILNNTLLKIMESDEFNAANLISLNAIIGEIKRRPVELDKNSLSLSANRAFSHLMERLMVAPRNEKALETVAGFIKIFTELALQPELWQAQNICFFLAQQTYPEMKKKAEAGDPHAKSWEKHFRELSGYLRVHLESSP